jgi:hypothetical protein
MDFYAMMMGCGLSTIIGLLWSFPMLFLNVVGLKLCKTSSRIHFESIKKILKGASIWINQEPSGWTYGYGFVGYIESFEDTSVVTIIAFDNFLLENKFIYNEEKEENVQKKEETLTIWCREGNYCWLHYNSININFSKNPMDYQLPVLNSIIQHINGNVNTSVLLYGKAGSGKSMIPMLIAKKLNYDLVDGFNPTDPGDTMSKMINRIKPTSNKKIIVVLEEIDIIIHNIHNNNIIQHKNIPTLVKNKEGWNNFLDKIDREFFEHIVLIMTSNQKPEYFDILDQSYMRKGRVNLKLNLELNKTNID